LRSCRPALPKCSCPALSFAAAFGHSATAQESIALPTIEVSAEQTSSGKQPATAPTLADLPVGASSELNVTGQTLNQRAYDRPAEVLEVVPGLIISQHSGKGKANQYFLRGYNLDHGTDLAIWVDGMPCNMRTHAHGQGCCDLNFLIPELISGVNLRKGPYWADEGDFASVGHVHSI
jgi:outer membrane cobalamin receptor